jgi:hypothetical protein
MPDRIRLLGRARLDRLLVVPFLLFFYGIFGIGSAHATALPMQQCTTTSGVVVAVDFGHWGGPVVRGCGSTPTSGYQLVNQGGFGTTGTVHDGPGFVCRIRYSGFNGGASYPTTAEVSCGSTPPASASWSYWNADPGQSSWTLNPTGAASTHPVAGAVQAWTFGGGSPTFSPDSVRAHNSPPATSTPASARNAGGTSAPASKPAARATGTGNRTTSGRVSQLSSRAGNSPSASPSTARSTASAAAVVPSPTDSRADGSSTGPTIVDAQTDAATTETDSGSYLPELAGGAVVLGLAGLAGFTAWQRKRAG